MNAESATETLALIKEAAVASGIYPYWGLSFGTVLGVCRELHKTGIPFIKHDNDMDVMILADRITLDQQKAYYAELDRRKLFKHRRRAAYRTDTGAYVWVSLKKHKFGCKCCNWFMFAWGGMMWHGKGKEWVSRDKVADGVDFDESFDGLMKGEPERLFTRLIEVPMLGGRYNVPLAAGQLLDRWYPQWAVPVEGVCSKRKNVLLVKRWADQRTWRLV